MPPRERMLASTPRLIAAAIGASGILAAAFGAHGLEKVAAAGGLRLWAVACSVQLVTAPVLALLALSSSARTIPRTSIPLLLSGVLVFSGSLYVMALGGPRWLGAVTPLGGLLLTAGWISLAFSRPPHAQD